jgi:DNA N-6-adenine-methyltransferase (Dam)
VTLIPIDSIRIDGGTQPRSAIFQNVIDDYADALSGGASFPAVTLFYDGKDYWLADGFHRHGAHTKLRLPDIDADIRQGTRRDAVLYSVGANSSHGLRRTNEDKRRAVMTLLQDEEWAEWSDREIARRASVSNQFVSNLRPSVNDGQIERKVERNGVTYTQNTANIGRVALQPVEVRESSEPATFLAEAHVTHPEPANDNVSPAAYRTSFTGENEWYTPERHVELAREVLGTIDLDPASNDIAQATVKASKFFTIETNGLDKPWRGKVWMNPPYSQPEIVHFTDKLIAEYKAGNVKEAIILTHNSTDTKWFDVLFKSSGAICFTTGRVKFVSPKGEFAAPAMGQAFTYFGPHPDRFAEVFSEIGNVVVPANDNTTAKAA